MRRDSQRANGGRCRNACRWRVEEEEEGLRLLARNASWCRSVGAASVRRRDAVVMVRQLLSEGQLSVMKSVCHCCCWRREEEGREDRKRKKLEAGIVSRDHLPAIRGRRAKAKARSGQVSLVGEGDDGLVMKLRDKVRQWN